MNRIARRRELFRATGVVLCGSLVGCDLLSTDPTTDDDGGPERGKDGKEAPQLAQQVAAGKLPPLKERIPAEPLVIEPLDRVGRYGGSLHEAEANITTGSQLLRVGAVGTLVEWDLRTIEPIPSIARSWELSDDGKTYTILLRPGVKWSDGQDFTAEDLVFYYEAILTNADLTPVPPGWLTTNGEPVEIVQVDANTVEFRFQEPNALFPRFLAYPAFGSAILRPAHYLKSFHPDFADPDALDESLNEANLETWVDLFEQKSNAWLNPELPVLGAWRVTQPAEEGVGDRVVMERNPFYWKVDTEGKQLPYIDRIVFELATEELIILKISRGDIDLQTVLGIRDFPVLLQNAEAGGYRVFRWTPAAPNTAALYTNQCHADPAIRELMQNRDFRAALSHSINRDEMNGVLYNGIAEPRHPIPSEYDPYHIEGSGEQFLEYDPDRANQLLDSLGLSERDGDGFRLRPDGQQLKLSIASYLTELRTDAYELVKSYWEDVGIRTEVENLEGTLWVTRVTSNQYDIAGYAFASDMWDLDPLWFVPTSDRTYWAPLFGLWYATGGAEGEQPPEHLRRLQQLYDELRQTVDDNARIALGREIIATHDENVWVLGCVEEPFVALIANNDMINVRQEAPNTNATAGLTVTKVEQVSYRNPAEHE